MTKTLFKNFKVCVTCVRWSGSRRVDGTRATIRFEDNQKGECIGGGFDRMKMFPMSAACTKYEQWLK